MWLLLHLLLEVLQISVRVVRETPGMFLQRVQMLQVLLLLRHHLRYIRSHSIVFRHPQSFFDQGRSYLLFNFTVKSIVRLLFPHKSLPRPAKCVLQNYK